MARSPKWVVAASLALALACREPAVSDGPWTAETTRLGDTTEVRTSSGSTWGRPARLVEEMRLGSLESGGETSFGAIDHVAVAEDGSFFLFDPQVPQVYRFDGSGSLLGLVGREGQGPGEYSSDVTGMVIVGDRLVLADADNARLSRYSTDGIFEGTLGQVSGLRSQFSPTLAEGPGGSVAVSVLMMRPEPGVPIPEPWPIGLELREMGGQVIDTIPPQSLEGARARSVAGPGGNGVLVTSTTDFLFELRHDDGRVLRVTMPFQRVEYTEAEARMMGRALAPVAAADGMAGADVAALKGAYLEYLFTPSGRIWARRPVADRGKEPSWRSPLHQPSEMDVFLSDGTYLGVVPLPSNSRPVAVTDTHLYVVELGAYDEPYLVRYRIGIPG